MGKTNSPLRIMIVGKELYESPEIQALIDHGHEVVLLDESEHFDLILGEPCWYMVSKLLPYLTWAMKESRRLRRERGEEKKKSAPAKAKAGTRRKQPPKSKGPSKVVPPETRTQDPSDEPANV